MEILKRYEEIDYALFEGDACEARYGLPEEVKFCKACVISNQRPNSCMETKNRRNQKKEVIHFGEDGVCDACKAVGQKAGIDWKTREEELFELCDRYRKRDGSYDCIVPGSGGKDSFYTSYLLRYKYHMHPLTVTWAPHLYTPWGYDNFQAWIGFGHLPISMFSGFLCLPIRSMQWDTRKLKLLILCGVRKKLIKKVALLLFHVFLRNQIVIM